MKGKRISKRRGDKERKRKRKEGREWDGIEVRECSPFIAKNVLYL